MVFDRPSTKGDPEVVFEDTHLIVLDKPAGLLSQGESQGDPNVVDWLRLRWGRPYVGLVHRLDRNTSGLMVVAKRTKSAQRLTAALQKGLVRRTYIALLAGELSLPARWAHWLVKNEATNKVSVFRDRPMNQGNPKEAILHVRPLGLEKSLGGIATWAEFELETGRSHQIRAQAAFESHPLLGDSKYAGKGARTSAIQFPRTALHSWKLEFPHPMSGEVLRYRSPPPSDFPKPSFLLE